MKDFDRTGCEKIFHKMVKSLSRSGNLVPTPENMSATLLKSRKKSGFSRWHAPRMKQFEHAARKVWNSWEERFSIT
jgi:hypothetical protein